MAAHLLSNHRSPDEVQATVDALLGTARGIGTGP
jgi:hypothetical protein